VSGPSAEDVWTVADFVAAVNDVVTDAFPPCWLRGEVAEFKAWSSGHWYFKLREGNVQVSCVMWKWANQRAARPQDGQEIFALVESGIYAQRGEFRLDVKRIVGTADAGTAARERERVKQALLKDGLFAPERKRPLPAYPTRVAVVTSADGAALRDIISVTRRRWPLAELLVVPARVQGESAPAELVAALERVNRIDGLDCCIVGRGGGARDDLAAFDDEQVCRAVARVRVPVVSAVGHETDTSFCDLVADVRAATPSNAAELVFADIDEVAEAVVQAGARLRLALLRRTRSAGERVERAGDRLESAVDRRLSRARERLAPLGDKLAAALARRSGIARTQADRLAARLASALTMRTARDGRRQAESAERLRAAILRRLAEGRARSEAAAAALQALSPLKVLERGYAIPRGPDGRVLRARAAFEPGSVFTLRVSDGDVAARVESA
jgi:exodeoxyribonuclease VII large subunit